MTLFYFYLKQSLKAQLAYHFDFIGQICLRLIMYGMKLLFLSSLFQYTDSLGNWSEQECIFVLYMTLLVTVFTDVFDISIFQFYRQVSLGSIQPHILKPVNIYSLMVTRWSRPTSVAMFLFFSLFFFFFLPDLHKPSFLNWLFFFINFLCGIICNILFVSLLSLSTFMIQRSLPIDYIYSEVLRLCPFPLSVYPEKSLIAIMLIIPSLFCASMPSLALLKSDLYYSWIFILSTVILTFIHKIAFDFMIKSYDGLGG